MSGNGNSNPITRAMVRAFEFLVPTVPSGNYHPVEIPWTGPGQPKPPTGGWVMPSVQDNSGTPPQNNSSK
jgi:hypothetical protein